VFLRFTFWVQSFVRFGTNIVPSIIEKKKWGKENKGRRKFSVDGMVSFLFSINNVAD